MGANVHSFHMLKEVEEAEQAKTTVRALAEETKRFESNESDASLLDNRDLPKSHCTCVGHVLKLDTLEYAQRILQPYSNLSSILQYSSILQAFTLCLAQGAS